MIRRSTLEKVLLAAVRGGVVLMTLVPLVVMTETAYPATVGKALYARTLIEIVFVLWVMLAVLSPSWRPPRSWLLALLGVGLAVSVLSALLGVSPQRSFWSTYSRMQGTVDLAHWFVLAVVAASVFRDLRSLRMLVTFHLGVGLLVSLVAVITAFDGWVPGLGVIAWSGGNRTAATLSNPNYLGAYLMVNVVLALGGLVRSFIRRPAPPPSRRPAARAQPGAPPDAVAQWLERLFYALVILFGLWGIDLSGSMMALMGVFAALGALMVLYAFVAESRRTRRIARVALGLSAGGAATVILVLSLAPSLPAFESPLLVRLSDPLAVKRTLFKRIISWKTGLAGFVERPVIGWGDANYVVVYGRYVSGPGVAMAANDHAHNQLIEEMATKGLLGAAAYVAIWLLMFAAVLRGVRGLDARDRAFGLFAGAAMFAQLAQLLTLFMTATSSLQYVLLLTVAVHFETLAWSRETVPRWRQGLDRALHRRAVRAAVMLGAVTLGGAGLASNHAIYSATTTLNRAAASQGARFMDELKKAIDTFGPMANLPRIIMFENVTSNWDMLRTRHPAEAARLLRLVSVEGPRAAATEPENWRVQHALARLYRTVARTDPEYAGRAEQHFQRSLELAPHKDPMLPLKPPHWYVDPKIITFFSE